MDKIKTIIWDELINLSAIDPRAELKGFFEALPSSLSGGITYVLCPMPLLGRRLLKLWKGLNESSFNAKIETGGGSLELDRKFGKVCFKLSEAAYGEITSRGRLKNGAGKWEWLRGLWGGCGSIYLPQGGYYMTFRVRDDDVGRRTEGILRSAGIVPRSRFNKGRIEYMLRCQEYIVTCLSKMGLVKSSLILEETAIVRSIRSRVNKLMNCDTANIAKSVDTAASQAALVHRIDSEGLWDRLTPIQAELASVRKANPSASLGELGQLLSKPVSKSTVEYRWRKLEVLVEDG